MESLRYRVPGERPTQDLSGGVKRTYREDITRVDILDDVEAHLMAYPGNLAVQQSILAEAAREDEARLDMTDMPDPLLTPDML